jgi:hypothetical protein
LVSSSYGTGLRASSLKTGEVEEEEEEKEEEEEEEEIQKKREKMT